MFGNIKNKVEERIKETLTPIYEQRDSLETKVSAIEEGEKRMHMDICQVTNNTAELTNYASHNIEEENALMHQMDACAKNLKTVADEHTEIVKTIKNYHEALTDLVEDNKHYTTPSKYLTEVPSVLRQTYQSHETKMDEMAECGRKMSMMALNAAIEAGRMGESGTQFVEISEEIRQASFVYEQAALSMKEEFKDTQKKIDELEECVLRLVALIKDGNVSAARLMKKSADLNKMAENSSMRDFSEDIAAMRDKVIAMRNLDEEITKSGERNKIQLDDIQEELMAQRENRGDLEYKITCIFQEIKEKL